MKKRSGFSAFAVFVALFLTIGTHAQNGNRTNLIAKPLPFTNTLTSNTQLMAFSGTEKQLDLHLDMYKRRGSGASPRLRNTGIVFTALGVATIVAGAIMVKQAGGQTYYAAEVGSNGSVEEGSIKGAFGALGIVGGAISTAGGGLMWFFGQRKLNH